MYPILIKSVNSFESYRGYRQTDTIPKTIFSRLGDLKTWRFDGKRGGQILHKSNTFSDENQKIIKYGFFIDREISRI